MKVTCTSLLASFLLLNAADAVFKPEGHHLLRHRTDKDSLLEEGKRRRLVTYGGYTYEDLKCPYQSNERLFKSTGVQDVGACLTLCAGYANCAIYSYSEDLDICMGCVVGSTLSADTRFDSYDYVPPPEAADPLVEGKKCPWRDDANPRLFTDNTGLTEEECNAKCALHPDCHFWSRGLHNRRVYCMGCELGNSSLLQVHAPFNTYSFEGVKLVDACDLLGSAFCAGGVGSTSDIPNYNGGYILYDGEDVTKIVVDGSAPDVEHTAYYKLGGGWNAFATFTTDSNGDATWTGTPATVPCGAEIRINAGAFATILATDDALPCV